LANTDSHALILINNLTSFKKKLATIWHPSRICL